MSQENVEIVRSISANWARGDFSSVGWAHPDIEFVSGDGSAVSRGLAGLAQRWREFLEAWETFATTAERIVDVGDDRVLVIVRFGGRGRVSGISTTDFVGGQVFTLRDGKVVRLVLYSDPKLAFQAVGLRE